MKMNEPLTNERVADLIVMVENLARTLKWESVKGAQKLLFVADGLRELLELRETCAEFAKASSPPSVQAERGLAMLRLALKELESGAKS
ncbi:hypothetical protein GTR05_004958 [Salmonella enterica]|nr:hypothetical protein [Salmonella enterica]